jgi:glycosyltransferase involved in cell wall biosynthesis
MEDGVSIIIPTYNGGEIFRKTLEIITSQNFSDEIDLVVIDSGSSDETVLVAESAGAKVLRIENKEFHHSRTRNSALQLAKFEKIVYLVQDAIPVSEKWLSLLCESLDQKDVVSVSVRQIPHADADVFARFQVEFHGEYLGNKPHLQQVESPETFRNLSYDEALHTIRHDNVCSIYRRKLLECYPFPDVEFAEDMAWAHAMLLRGFKLLYDPRIVVSHSHNRPPDYRFKRSIVESIACAKILGRVNKDISYLSVSDIVNIRDNLKDFSLHLKKQFNKQAGLYRHNFDIARFYFLGRKFVPYLEKIRNLSRKIMCPSENDCNPLRVQQDLSNHIRFVMSMIVGRYTLSSADDYTYCVDQVTATALGRVYGEFYSGHMLKGVVPREVDDLIRPYLKGV